MAEPAFSRGILDQTEPIEQPRRLRALGRIIPWPHQPQPHAGANGAGTGIRAKAEIRTKRFIDHHRVEEERYDAEVYSVDASLQGVMQALAEVFGEIDELASNRPAGEPLTMEIRLRV